MFVFEHAGVGWIDGYPVKYFVFSLVGGMVDWLTSIIFPRVDTTTQL